VFEAYTSVQGEQTTLKLQENEVILQQILVDLDPKSKEKKKRFKFTIGTRCLHTFIKDMGLGRSNASKGIAETLERALKDSPAHLQFAKLVASDYEEFDANKPELMAEVHGDGADEVPNKMIVSLLIDWWALFQVKDLAEDEFECIATTLLNALKLGYAMVEKWPNVDQLTDSVVFVEGKSLQKVIPPVFGFPILLALLPEKMPFVDLVTRAATKTKFVVEKEKEKFCVLHQVKSHDTGECEALGKAREALRQKPPPPAPGFGHNAGRGFGDRGGYGGRGRGGYSHQQHGHYHQGLSPSALQAHQFGGMPPPPPPPSSSASNAGSAMP